MGLLRLPDADPSRLAGSTNPVTSLEDLQGVKYRTVGLATNIMQGIGLKVVAKGGSEIFEAMETGVIDAFEYNNPTADRQFNAQDLAKHYMLGSYHQPAEFIEIIFNKDKFEALAPEQKAICEYAAEAASTANYGLAHGPLLAGPAVADE